MKRKRLASRYLGAAVVAIIMGMAGLYAVIVYDELDDEPLSLISCIEVEAKWLAWTCKQVLLHASLSPDHVRELNDSGGASYPVSMQDANDAEDILGLFLSRGVDINAADKRANDWTALHSAAMNSAPDRVAMLLRYGARTDVRDKHGSTPLDVARRALQRFPGDPRLPENIRLLEAAERNSPASR
ncbi:ankyrin repeat domain-containing protein [Noviherbaspirillum sp. CPCC 100848]|uniref:Ankyrin repeat domain-containing protein n=1 Tax=Noviherbaspirillum album TaxID=3080276 RepID=A0ABU6J922_9BURK|nr:ankyrin repeat domain-containing protein [Noviherbaspirillum sp. CPCC 100848]MEC4720155.1 ankyrin repeat domain-containing protein [Noviherbaspirillum sp. CPCC 100848]